MLGELLELEVLVVQLELEVLVVLELHFRSF